MTDWKVQKTIDYLANLNVGLPDSDWDDFLSRKSAHDLAVKRRRHFLTAVISVPAAAAVLLLLLLIPFKKVVPDNSLSQNNPPEPHVITDSIESPRDTITINAEHRPAIAQVKTKDSVREKVQSHNYGMVGRNNLAQDRTGSTNTGTLSENTGVSSIDSVNDLDSVSSQGFGSFGGVGNFGGGFGGFGGFGGGLEISSVNDITKFEEQTVKTIGADVRPRFIVSDNPDDSALVHKYPLIVLDGEIVDVSDDKLTAFDFGAVLMDRYQLAELVGIRGDKIQAVRTLNNKEAEEIWGAQGKNGVLEVLTRRYYRKVIKKKETIHGTKQPITGLKNKGE